MIWYTSVFVVGVLILCKFQFYWESLAVCIVCGVNVAWSIIVKKIIEAKDVLIHNQAQQIQALIGINNDLAKQNEGWLRQTAKRRGGRSSPNRPGEAGHGQNREG